MTATGLEGPLAGITVVSIEQAISGPLATRHLAELGARVIKVESEHGDSTRTYDANVHGMSSHFVWLNRGKESVRLNLRDDTDRQVFTALLKIADVFLSNMAPGALARLGFDPELLRRRHPRLIVVDISGFGSGGPISHRRAYDLLVQAEAGICSLTGAPDFPVKPGVPSIDIGTALYALASITTALYARERTGRGAYVPLAMFDVGVEMAGFALNQVVHTGVQPDPIPMGTPLIAPYGAYPTADGQTVVIGATSEREWSKLSRDLMNDESMASDPRFLTNQERIANRSALDSLIASWTSGRTLADIQRRADEVGLGNGRLNDVAAVSTHPQLQDRGRWHTATVNDIEVPAIKAPFVGGDWGSSSSPRVPALGEDTDRVRREMDRIVGPAHRA